MSALKNLLKHLAHLYVCVWGDVNGWLLISRQDKHSFIILSPGTKTSHYILRFKTTIIFMQQQVLMT